MSSGRELWRSCVTAVQVVAEGEHIMYTYDVSWQEVDIKWTRRWDAYLRGFAGTPEVQWFSVRNALLTALWLSVLIGVIFMHTVRRNLAENKVLRRLEQGKVCSPSHTVS